jgi:hypothetical protein
MRDRFCSLATLTLGLALTVPALVGCADPVDIATKACPCADGAFCCGSGVCAADQASCPAATLALARESAGEWTGYIENYELPSGSDSLAITIAVSGETVSGHVVFGDQMFTGITVPDRPSAILWVNEPPPSIHEGFEYQARNIRWEARRLKLEVPRQPVYGQYCAALQTLFAARDEAACPPNGVLVDRDAMTCSNPVNRTQLYDCDAVAFCDSGPQYGPYCSCTGQTCSLVDDGAVLHFDIALRGEIGDGSFGGNNVRLMRTTSSP